MNGKVSKRLRKEARLLSDKQPTNYFAKIIEKFTGKFDEKGNQITERRHIIFTKGYRAIYQNLKKQYLQQREGR